MDSGSLPDDLLLCILKQTLPCHAHITAAARSNRHAYFQHVYASEHGRYGAVSPKFPAPCDPCNAAWRACLSNIPAGTWPELPPWEPGQEADRQYGDTVQCAPASLVCKRWRKLLMQHGVKVAVCDLGEVPPESTEILVVASHLPWQNGFAAAMQLAYLRGLPSLAALVMWCTAPKPADAGALAGLTMPAVPRDLNSLQHLVYVTLPGTSVTATSVAANISDTVVEGIRAMTSLTTLSLPTLSYPAKADILMYPSKLAVPKVTSSVSRKLYATPSPQLRSLDAPFLVRPTDCCAAFTALRSLRVFFDGSALDDEAPLDLTPLSRISALHTLGLDCDTPCGTIGVGALQNVSALSLRNVHPERGHSDEQEGFEYPTSLGSLKITRDCALYSASHNEQMLYDLLELPTLPRLSLAIRLITEWSMLCALTTLEELRYEGKDCESGQSVRANGAVCWLTRLTALSLAHCKLTKGFNANVGRLVRLRKLDIFRCTDFDPEAVQSLKALEDLRLTDNCAHSCGYWNRTHEEWLAAMRLPESCPGLRHLALHRFGLAEEATTFLTDVWQLTNLETLFVYDCDVGMPFRRLMHFTRLHNLRALYLDGTYLGCALEHLQACKSLQCVIWPKYTVLDEVAECASEVDEKRGAVHETVGPILFVYPL